MTATLPTGQRETADRPTYDLLTAALEPYFGPLAGQWTEELRGAVKRYLLDELHADIFAWIVDPQTDRRLDRHHSDKAAAVDAFLAHNRPDEIALAVRHAAIAAVPSLRQLISDGDTWIDEEEQWDAINWLDAHEPEPDGTETVWIDIARHSRYAASLPDGHVLPEDLIEVLSPAELVPLVERYVGPAPTDLTDQEWQLLLPHFGLRHYLGGPHERSSYELHRKRRTLNGLRYKMAHDLRWSALPPRYGKPASVKASCRAYAADGIFLRMHDALKDNSKAAELMGWLEEIDVANDPPRVSGQRSARAT